MFCASARPTSLCHVAIFTILRIRAWTRSIDKVFAAAKANNLPVCMGRYEKAEDQPALVAGGARFVIASDDLVVLRQGLSLAPCRGAGEHSGGRHPGQRDDQQGLLRGPGWP